MPDGKDGQSSTQNDKAEKTGFFPFSLLCSLLPCLFKFGIAPCLRKGDETDPKIKCN